ncbi:unnamed protein product, partial [Rotaria sordida]
NMEFHLIPVVTSMEPVIFDLHYCLVTQFIGDCLKIFGLQIQYPYTRFSWS